MARGDLISAPRVIGPDTDAGMALASLIVVVMPVATVPPVLTPVVVVPATISAAIVDRRRPIGSHHHRRWLVPLDDDRGGCRVDRVGVGYDGGADEAANDATDKPAQRRIARVVAMG